MGATDLREGTRRNKATSWKASFVRGLSVRKGAEEVECLKPRRENLKDGEDMTWPLRGTVWNQRILST